MVCVTTLPCKKLDHDLFQVKFYTLLLQVQFLARDSIYAIARYMPSPVHLSVRHTCGSVKDG